MAPRRSQDDPTAKLRPQYDPNVTPGKPKLDSRMTQAGFEMTPNQPRRPNMVPGAPMTPNMTLRPRDDPTATPRLRDDPQDHPATPTLSYDGPKTISRPRNDQNFAPKGDLMTPGWPEETAEGDDERGSLEPPSGKSLKHGQSLNPTILACNEKYS